MKAWEALCTDLAMILVMAAANLFCSCVQQYAASKSRPLQVSGAPVAGLEVSIDDVPDVHSQRISLQVQFCHLVPSLGLCLQASICQIRASSGNSCNRSLSFLMFCQL